jgi:PEP-CTERM motif
MKSMKITQWVAALFAGAAVSVSGQTTYTSETAFVAALSSGYYLENFAGQAAFSAPASLSLSGGSPTVSYQISAPNLLYINQDQFGNNAVGNNVQSDNVTVSFTTPVYALGAEFYLTDISGNDVAGTTSIIFSDGTTGNITSTASGAPYGFLGVTSTTPITSLTIDANASGFVNMANFYTSATPVPEPATGLVLLTGIAGLACARRRK